MPQIEVTFDIDANGIVNVSAKDKGTGKKQQIRIEASGGLSDDDIDRMVREAEEHAGEDKERRELIDTRNQADAVIHATEKTLGDYGDKVSDEDKTAIESAVADLRGVLESEDVENIKSKTDTLQQVSMKLGEAMYQASQAEAAAGGGPGGGDSDSDSDETVVDADFEEVEDDKKSDG